ncbi:MAG: cobalamin B12-binding domain-containing protein [Desulfobacterales bacterium]|nr:cobalamin B12-binding domain-containing protein [Desulfobacterales bacterium]
MNSKKKIKVLIAKVGLDGHDRGARVISQMLRDKGMEVVYTGTLQTPQTVVKTAEEEDVDVIGLSFLAGGHITHTKSIIDLLNEKKLDDILIILGGVIPKQDIPILKKLGVSEVFRADSGIESIAKHIHDYTGCQVQGSRFRVQG